MKLRTDLGDLTTGDLMTGDLRPLMSYSNIRDNLTVYSKVGRELDYLRYALSDLTDALVPNGDLLKL